MTQVEIERLAARRQELWAGAPEAEPKEAEHIALQLEALYSQRRETLARERAGRSREDILGRERIIRNIDKLAGLD